MMTSTLPLHSSSSNNSSSYPTRPSVPGSILRYYKPTKSKLSLMNKQHNNSSNNNLASLILLLCLWYTLGIISISTSKYLLQTPLYNFWFLSVQQFIIGFVLLVYFRKVSNNNNKRQRRRRYSILEFILPHISNNHYHLEESSSSPVMVKDMDKNNNVKSDNDNNLFSVHLLLAALTFTTGFVLTNYSFATSTAPVVETVKASEPVVSTLLAVLSGVDTVTLEQFGSLVVLLWGVLQSTNILLLDSSSVKEEEEVDLSSFLVVMLSNFAFALRSMYQKKFRIIMCHKKVSDVEIQLVFQLVGAVVFCVPALVFNTSSIVLWLKGDDVSLKPAGLNEIMSYLGLTIVNGCAFTGYNLASTFILTRLSVVHHAVFNSLRRVVAIIATSFVFGLSFSLTQAVGIVIATAGFLSFNYFKTNQK